MHTKINCIVDTSGSMKEMGKSHLLLNLIQFIFELSFIDKKYKGIQFNYFYWNKDLTEITLKKGKNTAPIEPVNSASIDKLKEKIKEIISNDPVKLLILSDGYFLRKEVKDFNQWCETYKDLMIKTIEIGADADRSTLALLSTEKRSHKAENIASVIDSLIFGTNNKISPPHSINEISVISHSNIQ